MSVEEPYPALEELMNLIGEAGRHLADIQASEGAAGNISVYAGWEIDPGKFFTKVQDYELPETMPELAGGSLLATGSGRRLREVADDPTANLGLVKVAKDGKSAKLYTSTECLFARLTSEFNSHLAVHKDQISINKTNFHALIHAQPLHLTYLSHISRYQDEKYLNRHILRWQPEGIVQLHDGVGYIPFKVPGSNDLMKANVEMLRTHRIVLWAKHGVMSRSETSVKRACDLVEYAETGAHYEYMNLTNHGLADGLSDEEIISVCKSLDIEQKVF